MAAPQRISQASLRRISEPPPSQFPDAATRQPAPQLVCDGLDDATTRYVLATRPAFEDLRHAAGQIASLLILQATGANAAAPDHPMLAQARLSCQEARDSLAQAVATPAATHHHVHVSRAAALLAEAVRQASLRLAKRGDDEVDAIMRPLRQGWQEMHWASETLPGFETVNFGLACCAAHMQPAAPDGR